MCKVFFVVGATAVGKSALAAEVAERCHAEIVNADAYQVYRGLDILSGKPDPETRHRVPHHLLGIVPPTEEMSAAKFRDLAGKALAEIHSRGKTAIVVGGSGLYIRALTHGFDVPPPDLSMRTALNSLAYGEQVSLLERLHPDFAARVDRQNSRRVVRALEIALTTGGYWPERTQARDHAAAAILPGEQAEVDACANRPRGIWLVRDRDDLYDRINRRVEAMFRDGVAEEVRRIQQIGRTAGFALGYREIRQFLAGEISRETSIAKIQQATRKYAKRQLTWFRHQTTFPELDLTTLSHDEAVSAISRSLARE